MNVAYFGSKLSDNIAETPEGYLVCRDAVLGRTGFQTYLVSELSDEVRKIIGGSNPSAEVDLFRPPEEVFDPESIASLEGKPVVDNHPANKEWVNTSNIERLQKGHVQNVRKGDEALDSGDWPLLGDLVITHEPLISKVKAGLRQISLGYDYVPALDGDQLLQTKLKYNHTAILPQGRAGAEARINDSAPVIESPAIAEKATDLCVSCESGECLVHAKTSEEPEARQSTNKEKAKVPITDWFKHVTGLGLKALATDADTKPEQLTDAVRAISRMRATDEFEEDPEKKEEKKEEAKDRKMDDHKTDDHKSDDAAIKHATDCPCKDCAMDRKKADDKKADDHKMDDARMRDRARLHAALDRMMEDEMLMGGEEEDPLMEGGSQDADIKELRKLMDQYLGEEGKEPEHAMDEKEGIEEEEVGAEKGTDKAADGRSLIIEPTDEAVTARNAALDAKELSYLKMIRPTVAKSTDSALKKAGLISKQEFRARWRALTGKSKASDADYSKFAKATGARANDGKKPVDPYAELNAAYAARHAQEVK